MYEKIDKSRYTPMMRQYLTIKESYPDTLVFFRLGDFYEMFFNDALVASRELEIVLTGRDAGTNNERVPMCGVPFHAVETYIEKLSSKGYKVAIVEQLEPPGQKNIVLRDVIKVITPGTNVDEQYLDAKSNNYIACVENAVASYQIAYIDLSTGDAFLTIIPNYNDLLYSELLKLGVKEVVLGSKFPKTPLGYLKNTGEITISLQDELTTEKYLFGLWEGLEKANQMVCRRLISYIVSTQKRVLVHLKNFIYLDRNDYLRMDVNSIRNLELIESLHGNRFSNNLFNILDQCSTAMGSRFLKKNLLYPLVNADKIMFRQSLVSELLEHYDTVTELKKLLQDVYDLERIVGRISYGNLSPKDLLQLKRSLNVMPIIKAKLLQMNDEPAISFANGLATFPELATLLEDSINENAPFLLRDGDIIKSGYSSELDEIRDIGKTNRDYLVSLEAQERAKTGIKTLKVGYNKVFGYYIEVTKSYIPAVKPEFGYIRKQTTSNSERYITEELKEREIFILRSKERSLEIEFELFADIRNKCKAECHGLQDLATKISLLDMLNSFAMVARNNKYVRPTFAYYNEIEIKGGRHPVIEKTPDNIFIANDTEMGNDDLILLITGPNMSGKSTYMRQVALIAIMAQIGSFVPANSARLPLFDQIFTRIGAADDISSGQSTFMMEMLEVNFALANATEKSLILFDEVGRGTATFDGMALAQAIVEYIHDHVKAKTFFSTHYHELTCLSDNLAYLRNVHVEAKEVDGKIVFLHKVKSGPTDQSYGINVASLAKLPELVTLRAKDLLNKLENMNHYESKVLSLANYTEPVVINKLDPIDQAVLAELAFVDVENMKPLDALILLTKIKEKLGEKDG